MKCVVVQEHATRKGVTGTCGTAGALLALLRLGLRILPFACGVLMRFAKQVKAKAKAMAVALQTIGKFIVRKKVGENDQIFGR